MRKPFDQLEDSERRRLPLVARLVVGLAGLFVLACGIGWLGFVLWMALVHDGPNPWLAVPLAVLCVPCFSFGRQWVLEGLGRDPGAIGRRWRRIAGGLVMAVYGAAFVTSSTSIGSPELSTLGATVVASGPVSLGLTLIVGGGLLAVRTEPPSFILKQLAVLIGIGACGSVAAVPVCWEAGIAIPDAVRFGLVISLGLMLGLVPSAWTARDQG